MFVVHPEGKPGGSAQIWDPLFAEAPGDYRRASTRVLPGFVPLALLVYAPGSP